MEVDKLILMTIWENKDARIAEEKGSSSIRY